MKRRTYIFGLALLILTAGMAHADAPEEKARQLVARGVACIQEKGATEAARRFMDPDGNYVDGEYHLFFVETGGRCIAHGAQPSLVGTDLSMTHDADGILIHDKMNKAACADGSWAKYKYVNPVTGVVERKKAWVMSVPGMDAYIGCGMYY